MQLPVIRDFLKSREIYFIAQLDQLLTVEVETSISITDQAAKHSAPQKELEECKGVSDSDTQTFLPSVSLIDTEPGIPTDFTLSKINNLARTSTRRDHVEYHKKNLT